MDKLAWVSAVPFEVVPKKSDIPVPDKVDELLYMARIAESAERYDEGAIFVRKLAQINSELSVEERNLLSVIYKNVIGPRRTAWRIASSILEKETERGSSSPEILELIAMYRKQFEVEISAVCDDLNHLLDTYLVPAAATGDAKVFFLKMKGDYHRYHAEIAHGEDQKNQAHDVYKKALEIANGTLAPTHPIRLGLVLNFSVFYYEILKEKTKGVDLARQAYNEAVEEVDNIEGDQYDEAVSILGLLRDNLAMWEEVDQQ